MNKVSFFCLGKKGLDVLNSLEESFYSLIDCIVVGRDANVVEDYADELIAFAKRRNLRYEDRKSISVESINSSFLFLIGWRWLVQAQTGQAIIVFHDSLLPKYRGFNPLVTALIKGDQAVGVTALFGAEEFDKGDILAQDIIPITYPIKIASAIDLIGQSYSRLVNMILHKIQAGAPINGRVQADNEATYSLWRDEEDYQIEWNQEASVIKRMIDAVGYPYKGAFTMLNNNKIFVHESELADDVVVENRTPGKVIFKVKSHPAVVCGQGILILTKCYDDQGAVVDFKNSFRLRFK